MEFTVEKIEAKETYALRKKILREGIDLPYKFDRDLDRDTFHFGVLKDGKLIGIASFMKSKNDLFSSDQYQLRGMATSEEVRGIGAGKILINTAIDLLKNKGIKQVWCNARKEATTFYKKLGFKVTGNLFIVEKVGPHFTMFLDL
ncbi:Predicted N-acyltransferase, GNAT family [Tenacibaculum sp. MAR_2009_124]|uniref:GNAT family N-acetyltransferase n=1 Tax=Tenacibaculum sp. MAR_2009_124 TaxID=1250059 RepID=UPI0008958400|nr:GNAT family N-acetyltransferase [Tenacibaculum sp. MAR_2009_124]SEB35039.1 Predicted N-acyltransferase, GNAT family [Tenacibaculum sp. MAR_2009_124]